MASTKLEQQGNNVPNENLINQPNSYYDTAVSTCLGYVQTIQETAKTAWRYFPNFQEAATTSTVQASVNTIFGKFLTFKNVAAGNIVRDIAKTPSVIVNSQQQIQIGHTNNTFDEGTEYAQYSKIICKTALIGAVSTFYGNEHIEGASRGANFLCEAPNRVMFLAAMERQNLNLTNVSYSSYIIDHYNNDWSIQSVVGGIPKVAIMDAVGQVVGSTGIANRVKFGVATTSANVIGKVVPSFKNAITTSINQAGAGKTIATMKFPGAWDFFKQLNIKNTDSLLVKVGKLSLVPALIAVDFLAKFCGEMVSTFIFTPIARFTLDIGGKIAIVAENQYNEFFSSKKSDAKDHKLDSTLASAKDSNAKSTIAHSDSDADIPTSDASLESSQNDLSGNTVTAPNDEL